VIDLKCPSCGANLRFSDSEAGTNGQCCLCRAEIAVPPIAASTNTQAPQPPEQQAPADRPPPASDNNLQALQAAPTPPPASPAPTADPQPHAQPDNAIDYDAIPVAKKAEGLATGLKIAMILGAVLVAAAVGAVVIVTRNGAPPHYPVRDQAAELSKEAFDIVRPVRHIVTGARTRQLFDWKAKLRKASDKFAEILELTSDDPEEEKLLQAAREKAARDKTALSDRLSDIDDELWPVVKAGDAHKDMFPRVSAAAPIVKHSSGRGSGFLFEHHDKLWVATNRHVVDRLGQDGLKLEFLIGDPGNPSAESVEVPWKTAIAAIHRDADLALIEVPENPVLKDLIERKQVRPVKLQAAKLNSKAMDEIWTVGHPGGHVSLTATSGEITAIKRQYYGSDHYYGKLLQISAEVYKGNSGCPVFNSAGRVVGIVSFGRRIGDGHTVNYAVDVDALWKLLNQPDLRLSVEEVRRLTAVADAYSRYAAEMETQRWRLRPAIRTDRKSEWSEPHQGWISYRLYIFKATLGARYAVMAVKDPKHPVQFIGLPEGVRPTEQGDRLLVKFQLAGETDRIMQIGVAYPDPDDSKKDWPIHVGIFEYDDDSQ